MTPASDLRALIAKLEAAKEGSRELDWGIAECLGEIPQHTIKGVGWDYDWYRQPGELTLWRAKDAEGRSVEHWQPKERTRSVDAALTLVPEGLCWRYDSALGGAQIFDLASSPIEVSESGNAELTSYPPALALCIAALHARLAEMEDDQ